MNSNTTTYFLLSCSTGMIVVLNSISPAAVCLYVVVQLASIATNASANVVFILFMLGSYLLLKQLYELCFIAKQPI